MMIRIVGKTFDHREALKRLGAQWNSDSKSWELDYPSDADRREISRMAGCQLIEPKKELPKLSPKPKRDLYNSKALEYAFQRFRDPEPKHGSIEPNIFGDDRTYLNYFASKNPISFFGFSGITALAKFVEAIPDEIAHEKMGNRNTGWKKSFDKTDWTGTASMEDALELAWKGWQDGTDRAAEIVEMMVGHHAKQRRRRYSVAGGTVNIGRLLANNPTPMHSRPKQDGQKVVTFFCEVSMSASIKPETAIERAALIAAMIDIMENNGYSCEVVSTCSTRESHKPLYQMVTTLKAAGEPLNLNDVVFGLGHPSYLRRLGFACFAVDDNLRFAWHGMGVPMSSFTDGHQPGPNEYYVKHITHELNPILNYIDDERDRLLTMWQLIVDKTLPITINGLEENEDDQEDIELD